MEPNQKKSPREDDVLEGILYPRFCYSLNADQITEEMLNEEIQKYIKDIEPFVKDYLWHRDNLTFHPRTKQVLQFENSVDGSSKPTELELIPHINITLRFDEDIGDEWFVVFLLFHLTKKYEGLIARVSDSDGEFLLIEAADELPPWANPETCQNRVFIMSDAVHVVHDKQKNCVNILNSVYQRSHIFRMSDKVQAIIHKRIGIYPEEIENRKHKARAFLSEKADYIFKKQPNLVAAAIRTIYHSDPLERKVCRGMRYFPPEQRRMVNIKMTKCLYAMAMNCRYNGDPRTGWNIPPSNSPKYKAYLLGIKIACGLELLVARAHEERRRKNKEIEVLENNEQHKFQSHTWFAFLNRLETNGYFKGLLEGSDEHIKLLSNAKEYYLKNLSGTEVASRFETTEAEQVLNAWLEIQSNDIEPEVKDESSLSPESSSSWMNVDPAQLDAMLGQQFNFNNLGNEKSLNIQEKVEAFLNQKSGIDGVDYFQDNEQNQKHEVEDNGRIDFDADVFDSTLRDILDLVVPGEDGEFDGSSEDSLGGDDEDGGSEMQEYMKMMDEQLKEQLVTDHRELSARPEDIVEANLLASMQEEAGGTGPVGNILGGPLQRLKELQLQTDSNPPPPDV